MIGRPYSQVLMTFAFSSVQPRVAIDQFENLLFGCGYEAAKTQFLVDSLRCGFDLGYTGNFEACASNNLISAISKPQILSELIDKEVTLGRFLGPYTVDAFSLMGSSSSRIFQNFSDSIAFFMHHPAGVDHVVNYLNDFLGIECSMSVAPDKVRNSMLMGENLGIPFAPDKCEGPTPVLTFLGIDLDCVNLEARLPQVKISKAINLIQSFLQSPRQRYSRLESLHGFLNHCAEIIPAGKAFLRSLQRLLHPSSSHWVTIPSQVVLDLQTWLTFFTEL